ncbi:MAG: glutamyl-tRNA reductase [Anaerolineae bacterium]|nr:glutamyl-tRNA reductase [Ardenticatenia bacterium]MBK8541907.1 glutamyl-tRNA reductase [Ardenticatenia bacterium]HQZ70959.1 glutamyl-tRNA reductase [Anaerolineae bacterium]
MTLICIGLSHHSAPVELREQLTFPAERLPQALGMLAAGIGQHDGLREATLLSTCNRTELYVLVDAAPPGAIPMLAERLIALGGADAAAVGPHLYTLTGPAVVRHLMRVAVGLDAMVVGEAEIQGQVRQASEAAATAGAAGVMLDGLFTAARRAARRARHETRIGQGAASVPSAAVQLAERITGGLAEREILLVGAGKMGLLTAQQLLRLGAARIVVSNRSFARARDLAGQWGGQALPLARVAEALRRADVVLSSTGAPGFVIRKAEVQAALAERESPHPLLLIDMAVPRDVDPAVRGLPGVTLVDLDDIQARVAATLEERHLDIPRVEALIDEETSAFMRLLAQRDVQPTVAGLHRWAEAVGRAELAHALRRLGPLAPEGRAVLEAMVQGLVGKMIHPAIAELKRQAGKPQGKAVAEEIARLFGLTPSGVGEPQTVWSLPPAEGLVEASSGSRAALLPEERG